MKKLVSFLIILQYFASIKTASGHDVGDFTDDDSIIGLIFKYSVIIPFIVFIYLMIYYYKKYFKEPPVEALD